MQTWNVVPDRGLPALSEQNCRRLTEHYRADAQLLAHLNIRSSFLDRWLIVR